MQKTSKQLRRLEGFLKVFDLPFFFLWSSIIMIINMNKHEMHLFISSKQKAAKYVKVLQSVTEF